VRCNCVSATVGSLRVVPATAFPLHLLIHHTTTYSYAEPVSLSPHLLYLRPRETSRQRLRKFELTVEPVPKIIRVSDPLENEMWTAVFSEDASDLFIRTQAEVETREGNPFDFLLDDYAQTAGFAYDPVLKFALGPYLAPPFDDTQKELKAWIDANFTERPTGTVEMMTAFNNLIFQRLRYVQREERGIQSSLTTLQLGSGACRDFAVLFTEMCRTLGLAARFISGYLFAPADDTRHTSGAMHAWAEVYLPGAGWKAVDPTHGIWCDERYVPVAHGAQAESVNPVQGAYFHPRQIGSTLAVEVKVEAG